MASEHGQAVAEERSARQARDTARYRANQQRLHQRLSPPAVSARGVAIEADASAADALPPPPTTTSPAADNIDYNATSRAIRDALRKIGKRGFEATKEERDELRDIIAPSNGRSPQFRLNSALLFAFVVLGVIMIVRRDASAKRVRADD